MRRTPDELEQIENEVIAIGEIRIAVMRYLVARGVPPETAITATRGKAGIVALEMISTLDDWIDAQRLEQHK